MRLAAVVLLCSFVSASHAFGVTLTVAAAANMQIALEDIIQAFNGASTGKDKEMRAQALYGPSGKLTAQIQNGAPYDIFLSADLEYPALLFAKGLTIAAPRVYAYGTLVVWTKRDLSLDGDLTQVFLDKRVKKIAVPNPEVAPYGREAMKAMAAIHVLEQVRSQLVFGESVAQATQYVETGAADVGITAKSLGMAKGFKGRYRDLPSSSYDAIAQGVVIVKGRKTGPEASARLSAAAEFVEFLLAPKAGAILTQYGYELPIPDVSRR